MASSAHVHALHHHHYDNVLRRSPQTTRRMAAHAVDKPQCLAWAAVAAVFFSNMVDGCAHRPLGMRFVDSRVCCCCSLLAPRFLQSSLISVEPHKPQAQTHAYIERSGICEDNRSVNPLCRGLNSGGLRPFMSETHLQSTRSTLCCSSTQRWLQARAQAVPRLHLAHRPATKARRRAHFATARAAAVCHRYQPCMEHHIPQAVHRAR